ncbi:hypothetical protein HY989_04795 [Candidatus Micrarchaeota archaeon]|nr:hypothetical protein [Candidatus Micrarchaeota archaeon]
MPGTKNTPGGPFGKIRTIIKKNHGEISYEDHKLLRESYNYSHEVLKHLKRISGHEYSTHIRHIGLTLAKWGANARVTALGISHENLEKGKIGEKPVTRDLMLEHFRKRLGSLPEASEFIMKVESLSEGKLKHGFVYLPRHDEYAIVSNEGKFDKNPILFWEIMRADQKRLFQSGADTLIAKAADIEHNITTYKKLEPENSVSTLLKNKSRILFLNHVIATGFKGLNADDGQKKILIRATKELGIKIAAMEKNMLGMKKIPKDITKMDVDFYRYGE